MHINQVGQQAPVFDASISAFGQSAPFSFALSLAKGNVVNFTVLAGSGFTDLTTGLSLHVKLQPAS